MRWSWILTVLVSLAFATPATAQTWVHARAGYQLFYARGDDTEVALFRGGVQVGAFRYEDTTYRPYDKTTDTWGEKGTPPVELPAKPTPATLAPSAATSINFEESSNILIEGVTLRNSPMWQVHPVLCTNVTVRDLTIVADGPNTDGWTGSLR